MADRIFVGGGGEGYGVPQNLLLKYGNRHGLIAGATGTGKTVTLQILAEGFSAAGVPVFMADVKGDLAGIAAAGSTTAKLHDAFAKRAATIGLDLQYRAFPVTYWDLFGAVGPSGARHGRRDGAVVAGADPGVDRPAGGGAERGVPAGRRRAAAAAGPEGPAGAAGLHRRERDRDFGALWPGVDRPRSARSSGSCWCWRIRARRRCSANRHWSWPT